LFQSLGQPRCAACCGWFFGPRSRRASTSWRSWCCGSPLDDSPERPRSLATGNFLVVGVATAQPSMLTARAATRMSVTIEIDDWISISSFAHDVSGNVSLGLNADAFVNER
jgi:hypothetical protein